MQSRIISMLVLLVGLGCQAPRTATTIPESRPRIAIQGAPAGARVFVDGREAGAANAYTGDPGVLLLEPGAHAVEVRSGDRLLLAEKVFLGGGELRTLIVR